MKNIVDFKSFRQILFSIVLSLIFLTTANAAGVSLSATPPENTVNAGQTATYTIKINRDAFADKVTLSASGLPSGATASFAPNTTTAASSVLTVKTLTTTPVGTFNITIKGTANGITIAPITLKVTTKAVGGSISVSVTPATQSIIAGQSTFYDVAINRTNYEGAVKLTAENLPNGITVQFEPPTTTGNTSRMYLYSNGLPFLPNEFSMIVRVRGIADTVENWTKFYAVINCGINWAEQFGTPDNQTLIPDFATDVTFDSLGNVYAAGYNFQGATETNAWVAKFDKFGVKLWTRTITTFTEDRATNVFVDSAGNVYMAGITKITPSNFVNYNIFVAKFDANGNQNPNIITPGTNHEEGEVMQFGINSSGNVTLTAATQVQRVGIGTDVNGERRDSVDFDITRFVFDANLNILGNSSQPIINNAVGNPKDLKIGADGSIYVLKEDLSQIDMGGFKDVRISVEKFNAPNNQNWHSVWLDPTPTRNFQNTTASRLAIDAAGNVFAIGNIHEPEVSPGSGGLFLGPRPTGFYSWFVAFNPNSTVRWQKEIAYGEFGTTISALDVDAQGNIFYGGYTFASLGGNNSNQNGSDAFFAKISGQNGNNIFLRQFNVANKDGFNALKIGSNGEIFFAGYTVLFKNVNYGFEDALVMKYSATTCLF